MEIGILFWFKLLSIFLLILLNCILYKLKFTILSTIVTIIIIVTIILFLLCTKRTHETEPNDHNDLEDINTTHIIDLSDFPKTSKKTEECVICLERLDSAIILSCNHIYHRSCIEQLFKYNNSCPLCRCPILSVSLIE